MEASHILHPAYGHALLREWQQVNTHITKAMLIYPLFIIDEDDAKKPINSMPEQYQLGVNQIQAFLEPLVKKGLRSVLLFGVLTKEGRKDEQGIIYN
jgi:porphobilinogen synthase